MTDFDYDVLQKKRLAASARHRVCGSKSKKCTLPSDYLTPAQIKARSGPCMKYQLNKPMSYATFKAMPRDLQAEYLNSLHARFGVGATAIGKDMFKVSANMLWQYLAFHEMSMPKGKRLDAREQGVWWLWLNGATEDEADCEPAEPEAAEDAAVKATTEEPASTMEVDELTAVFSGVFDANRFIKWMSMLPIPQGNVRIKVEVTRHE